MAKIKGNSVLIYVNDVAIGCLNNCEFTSTNEEIDATCKDNDGAYDSLSGGNTSSISFDGTYDTASANGLSILLGLHLNKTEFGVRMGIAGTGGLYIQAARSVIDTMTWSGPLNAVTVYNGNIKIRGVWTKGTHT